MKKVQFFLIVLFCMLNHSGSAQHYNIWNITNQFLIEQGERDSTNCVYPFVQKDGQLSLPYVIIGDDVIQDPNYTIPNERVLQNYMFGILAPHKPMHFLYIKNGVWCVINMKKGLLNIIQQCIIMCQKLSLDDQEALSVFDAVIKSYKYNQENQGGV